MISTLRKDRHRSENSSLRELHPQVWRWKPDKPDVKGDGHHGVEDDDVRPEGEEGGETSADAVFPRQEDGEPGPFVGFPDVVSNGQNEAHEGQEAKDLQGENTGAVWASSCSWTQAAAPAGGLLLQSAPVQVKSSSQVSYSEKNSSRSEPPVYIQNS